MSPVAVGLLKLKRMALWSSPDLWHLPLRFVPVHAEAENDLALSGDPVPSEPLKATSSTRLEIPSLSNLLLGWRHWFSLPNLDQQQCASKPESFDRLTEGKRGRITSTESRLSGQVAALMLHRRELARGSWDIAQ